MRGLSLKRPIIIFFVIQFFFTTLEEVDITKGRCYCIHTDPLTDCNCTMDTIDKLNNLIIYPRLQKLLTKSYFRFFKVDLSRDCPFWPVDGKCTVRDCNVRSSAQCELPPALKGKGPLEQNPGDCDSALGDLDTTLSSEAQEHFQRWKLFDDTQESFCVEEGEDFAEYVDLSLNPERYTGYKGESAHRIWKSIYMENCFKPEGILAECINEAILTDMCFEHKVFYRVISGLHTSINVHVCANYLLSTNGSQGLIDTVGVWGANLTEYLRRFSSDTTNGEGPHRIKNLYFLYILELRALDKVADALSLGHYYTGIAREDEEVAVAVRDLMCIVRRFPDHFNENCMFQPGEVAGMLKREFKEHFRNISRIMDCVGCDKCKLWGKLQVLGLGTALEILFSEKFDKMNILLDRKAVVALLNAFGRLSTSIYEVRKFEESLQRSRKKS